MSVCRKLPDGTIQKIAGHTILLDANASEIRKGTFSCRATEDHQGVVQEITFTDPMPDTDYVVVIEPTNHTNWGTLETEVYGKTTTGFTIRCWLEARDHAVGGVWTAWKPVKIEGYTELQNKVSNPDDTPTIDSMNLVTSDGVARAIENASAVWKGTKAEWNALPAADKMKYDLAVLLDQTLVKAIDRTDGTETNVADLSGQFVGTHAEWDAETNKTQYKTAVLTDDRKTVNEVTGTGALNEVADDARIWRGTQEEWDAMSAADKAKWNVAHIEDGSPVFSKHIFPDYANPIVLPDNTTTWTATEDVYIQYCYTTNSNSSILYIDGNRVSTYDTFSGSGIHAFSGYVRKGSVINSTGGLMYATSRHEIKIFPLL